MADPRFYSQAAPLTAAQLASLTGASVRGDDARTVQAVAPLEGAGETDLSFLDNPKYLAAFQSSQAGICFVSPAHADKAPEGMTLLITPTPYAAYATAAGKLFPAAAVEAGIDKTAQIDKSATIGKGARIDAGAVIGANAKIGDGCWIGAYAVIGAGVTLGKDCRIHSHTSITHAQIGDRAFIHAGVRIGNEGFGFAPGPQGIVKIPQLGRVILGNDVEIGANSCIDRGANADTVLGDGCKIDNLVQIGHNCRLGRFVVVSGQCGLSGSTRIEDGAMLGGQVGTAGHLTIGKGAKIAAQSGVVGDVPAGETWGGYPAQPIREWHRQTAGLKQLTKRETA